MACDQNDCVCVNGYIERDGNCISIFAKDYQTASHVAIGASVLMLLAILIAIGWNLYM